MFIKTIFDMWTSVFLVAAEELVDNISSNFLLLLSNLPHKRNAILLVLYKR